MDKLKAAILYECSTKIKAMCIFYVMQYAIVALIFAVVTIVEGGIGEVGSSGLEASTVIFVSIIGVLGYKEDFKALIQNGYTRRYIFLATISMFILMAGTMALIDTIIGNVLHYFMKSYFAIYGSLYGYSNVVANWLWLTALYLMSCVFSYLVVLVINKAGKLVSLYLGVALGGIVLVLIALFRFVLSDELITNIVELLMRLLGFMSDGRINYIIPILTLLVIGTVCGIGSYAIIRRTELR